MMLSILKKSIVCVSLSIFFAVPFFADETYRVQKGDTLYSISRKFQITVAELRAANNLSESDVLKADQKLVIPSADIGTAAALSSNKNQSSAETKNMKTSDYTVQKGDTLYGIARKNGISVPQLLALNGLDSSAVIKVGQKIKIKDNGSNASAENASSNSTSVAKKDTGSSNAANSSSSKKDVNENAGKVEKSVSTDNKSASSATSSSKNSASSVPDEIPDTRTYGITINSDSSIVWPVKNPVVTQVKGKVSGVQLSAKENESVKCIHEGTVMFVGLYRGFGQVLFVQSKTGLIYAYTGLEKVKPKKGDYVLSGADLGVAGIDSITKKPQITFMVFQNGQPIDPAKAPRN